MKIRVYSAEGTELGEFVTTPDKDGLLRVALDENAEVTVWGESGGRLHRKLDHMDAIKSGNLHWSGSDSTPRLDDGTPLTEEIVRYWGMEPVFNKKGEMVGFKS